MQEAVEEGAVAVDACLHSFICICFVGVLLIAPIAMEVVEEWGCDGLPSSTFFFFVFPVMMMVYH